MFLGACGRTDQTIGRPER